MRRPQEEILTGNQDFLDNMNEEGKDFYASEYTSTTHNIIDEIDSLLEELSEELREIFYRRFGEHQSIRKIAADLGYKSPWPIQVRIDKIKQHIRENIGQFNEGYDDGPDQQPSLPLR